LNHRQEDKKNKIAHDVHLTEGALLSKISGKRTLGVNSTHHQAVAKAGELFQVTGRSADGIVESVELKPELAEVLPFLLSVQFHPERLAGRHPEHRGGFLAVTHACKLNRHK
jgi:putative glutamine amidotransferase